MKNKFFTLHGHFYQPPRSNPWHLTIEAENAASPYHNFNRKITDECYGPLSIKKIKKSDMDFYISLYSLINFNFGPTLLSWIEEHYPNLYITLMEADKISQKIFASGNAIAQPYNHRIMPLANEHDKRLQIKWGIEFFESKFKRKPLGIWLPELAVDNETLNILTDFDLKFTILSQGQAKKFKLKDKWEENKLDTIFKPYRWLNTRDSNKSITIFFYDDYLQKIINTELKNTEKFYLRILSKYSVNSEKEAISIATDGEIYGHHIKNGDLYLYELIKKILSEKKIELTNYSLLLEKFKDIDEVLIAENTSWSCPHGIKRWKENCGCRINPVLKNQNWRAELKFILDEISEKANRFYYKEAIKYFTDPEKTLFDYIKCLINKNPHYILSFIKANSDKNLTPDEVRKALLLLELVKNSQLSLTSCAFFFDDITSIEPLNAIKFAIKTAEIGEKVGLELNYLINEIKKIKSNFPKIKMENIVEELRLKNNYPYPILIENLYLHLLDYRYPFNRHINYRFKMFKESKKGDLHFFQVSIAEMNTLIKQDFFIEMQEIADNKFFKIREDKISEFETNIEKALNKKLDYRNILDKSILSEEALKIIDIFTSQDKKKILIKELLKSANNLNGDFKNTIKFYELLKNNLSEGVREEEIAFLYEIIQITLPEIYINYKNYKKESEEILKIIKKLEINKILWKYEMMRDEVI